MKSTEKNCVEICVLIVTNLLQSLFLQLHSWTLETVSPWEKTKLQMHGRQTSLYFSEQKVLRRDTNNCHFQIDTGFVWLLACGAVLILIDQGPKQTLHHLVCFAKRFSEVSPELALVRKMEGIQLFCFKSLYETPQC